MKRKEQSNKSWFWQLEKTLTKSVIPPAILCFLSPLLPVIEWGNYWTVASTGSNII